jgi:hypothetical protein
MAKEQSKLPKDIERMTKRPAHIAAPAHWSDDPAPDVKPGGSSSSEQTEKSPTRYGDWVYKGIAIDF